MQKTFHYLAFIFLDFLYGNGLYGCAGDVNQNEDSPAKPSEAADEKKENKPEADVGAEVLSPKSFLTASHSSLHSLADNDSSATLSADEGSHSHNDEVHSHQERSHSHSERNRLDPDAHLNQNDEQRRTPHHEKNNSQQAELEKLRAAGSREVAGDAAPRASLTPGAGINPAPNEMDYHRSLNSMMPGLTTSRSLEASKSMHLSSAVGGGNTTSVGSMHPGFDGSKSEVPGLGKSSSLRVRDLIHSAIERDLQQDRSYTPPCKNSKCCHSCLTGILY